MIDCNTFWMISGTTKNVTKSDPRTRYLSPKNSKKYKTFMGTSLKYIILNIWESGIMKCVKGMCTYLYSIIWNFENFDFETGKCVLGGSGNLSCCFFEICKFEMLKQKRKNEILKFEILNCDMLELWRVEMSKLGPAKWRSP